MISSLGRIHESSKIATPFFSLACGRSVATPDRPKLVVTSVPLDFRFCTKSLALESLRRGRRLERDCRPERLNIGTKRSQDRANIGFSPFAGSSSMLCSIYLPPQPQEGNTPQCWARARFVRTKKVVGQPLVLLRGSAVTRATCTASLACRTLGGRGAGLGEVANGCVGSTVVTGASVPTTSPVHAFDALVGRTVRVVVSATT